MRVRAFSDLPVAILCGGFGTRLGELTRTQPKSMMDVGGRPFIEWQIELLRMEGLRNIVLCAHHLADALRQIRGVGFSFDGAQPAGTGGAIKKALPLLGDEFFVLYGDSYLSIPYEPIFQSHRASGKPATLSVWDGVDYGMNIFQAHVFSDFSDRFSLNSVVDALERRGDLNHYQAPARFMEIGSPEGLQAVRKLLT